MSAGSIDQSNNAVSKLSVCVKRYVLAWTSDASGNVNGTSISVNGEILRVTFIPGSGGVQPTAYNAKLNDQDGIDCLAAQGTTLSNTTTTHIKPSVAMKDGTTTSTSPIFVAGTLELRIDTAGNAKQGTVILYIR